MTTLQIILSITGFLAWTALVFGFGVLVGLLGYQNRKLEQGKYDVPFNKRNEGAN